MKAWASSLRREGSAQQRHVKILGEVWPWLFSEKVEYSGVARQMLARVLRIASRTPDFR